MPLRRPGALQTLSCIALLTATLLAGCSDGDGAAGGFNIRFDGVLEVTTTATEPFEFRGTNLVAWNGDLFGLYAQMEPDLNVYSIRDENTAYDTIQGLGWTRYDLGTALEAGELSNRLLLWDLKLLLSQDLHWSGDLTDGTGTLHGAGPLDVPGPYLEASVDLEVKDGRPVRAVLRSEQGRESPFTFTPSSATLGFTLQVPKEALPLAEVQEKDGVARDGHSTIIGWLLEYQRRNGRVPQTVDAQTLIIERGLVDPEPWPESPYDGTPLHDALDHGHFVWDYCGPQDATYHGYGWDVPQIEQVFGKGCQE